MPTVPYQSRAGRKPGGGSLRRFQGVPTSGPDPFDGILAMQRANRFAAQRGAMLAAQNAPAPQQFTAPANLMPNVALRPNFQGTISPVGAYPAAPAPQQNRFQGVPTSGPDPIGGRPRPKRKAQRPALAETAAEARAREARGLAAFQAALAGEEADRRAAQTAAQRLVPQPAVAQFVGTPYTPKATGPPEPMAPFGVPWRDVGAMMNALEAQERAPAAPAPQQNRFQGVPTSGPDPFEQIGPFAASRNVEPQATRFKFVGTPYTPKATEPPEPMAPFGVPWRDVGAMMNALEAQERAPAAPAPHVPQGIMANVASPSAGGMSTRQMFVRQAQDLADQGDDRLLNYINRRRASRYKGRVPEQDRRALLRFKRQGIRMTPEGLGALRQNQRTMRTRNDMLETAHQQMQDNTGGGVNPMAAGILGGPQAFAAAAEADAERYSADTLGGAQRFAASIAAQTRRDEAMANLQGRQYEADVQRDIGTSATETERLGITTEAGTERFKAEKLLEAATSENETRQIIANVDASARRDIAAMEAETQDLLSQRQQATATQKLALDGKIAALNAEIDKRGQDISWATAKLQEEGLTQRTQMTQAGETERTQMQVGAQERISAGEQAGATERAGIAAASERNTEEELNAAAINAALQSGDPVARNWALQQLQRQGDNQAGGPADRLPSMDVFARQWQVPETLIEDVRKAAKEKGLEEAADLLGTVVPMASEDLMRIVAADQEMAKVLPAWQIGARAAWNTLPGAGGRPFNGPLTGLYGLGYDVYQRYTAPGRARAILNRERPIPGM